MFGTGFTYYLAVKQRGELDMVELLYEVRFVLGCVVVLALYKIYEAL